MPSEDGQRGGKRGQFLHVLPEFDVVVAQFGRSGDTWLRDRECESLLRAPQDRREAGELDTQRAGTVWTETEILTELLDPTEDDDNDLYGDGDANTLNGGAGRAIGR